VEVMKKSTMNDAPERHSRESDTPKPLQPDASALTTATTRLEPCQCGNRRFSLEVEMTGELCLECWRKARDEKAAIDRALAECGVAERHMSITSWEALLKSATGRYKSAVEKSRVTLDKPGTILGLIGGRGTGKTQIASVATLECCRTGKRARIIKNVLLIADLKKRFGTASGDSDWLREWRQPNLLVLDEFSLALDTQWSRSMLCTLIDSRYDTMKNTVLIANLTEAEWDEQIDPSIRDRCNEGGGVILCSWPSFRR
jgi:DNA replication protein DnaC